MFLGDFGCTAWVCNITHRIHGTGMYLSPVTLISMVNAGKHTIRGSYGYAKYHTQMGRTPPKANRSPEKRMVTVEAYCIYVPFEMVP